MHLRQLYQWVKKEAKQWSGLTRHEVANIEVFSRGVVRAESSHIRRIAGYVGGQAHSQRRRLQRFVSKPGSNGAFFQAWTGSVVRRLRLEQIVVAVDETKLLDRVGVMVVGLVVAERCIPLAWRCYAANEAAGYPAEGQVGMIEQLLASVQAGLPAGCQVRVLADRGIGCSPKLMRVVMNMGWTFLFRVTKQSKLILADGTDLTFYDQVQAPGQCYAASGTVFKKRGHIPGHVRVVWLEDAQAPWALVTNDPTLTGWEYAQRMWIEEAFRDLKSHGWDCEDAALDQPQRVERLWILLVVAYAWLLLIGIALEQRGLTQPRKRRKDGAWVRSISLFREGRQACLADPFF